MKTVKMFIISIAISIMALTARQCSLKASSDVGRFLQINLLQQESSEQKNYTDKQKALILKEQANIDRLSKQLDEAKQRLQTLRFGRPIPKDASKRIVPDGALVVWMPGEHVPVLNIHSSADFQLKDKLLFLRHENSQYTITGVGRVNMVYPDDLDIVIESQLNKVHPEDEAYIINRDDSPYSLANHQF